MASTVITVFATAAMVGVMLSLANSSNRVANVTRSETEARYLSEGAIEMVKKDLIQDLAKWDLPTGTYSVTLSEEPLDVTAAPSGYFSASSDSAGIQTWLMGYVLECAAESGTSSVTSRALVNVEATPIYQFAVFYDDDLEIHPGPDMILGGRVHSNRDVFMSTSGSTVKVNSNYLRSVGSMYRHRKHHPFNSGGEFLVRKWVENPFDTSVPVDYEPMYGMWDLAHMGIHSGTGFDSSFTEGWDHNGDGDFDDINELPPFVFGALEFWAEDEDYTGPGEGFTVLTGEHGITESVTPDIESIKKFEAAENGDHVWDEDTESFVKVAPGTGDYAMGYFHANAGLKVIVMDDGSLQITGFGGDDLTSELSGVITVQEIYDARQADGGNEYVTVASVDVAALNASGYFPENGLIYAAAMNSGNGTDCGGLHLWNGDELAAPLTAVCEGALYVEGDYNTTDKKGAAVIADAVNLLSNAWDNTKGAGDLPDASDTTYNMAIVTGNTETTMSDYNGGLENLPRFHEKWSGKTAEITGSFINIWKSELCDGAWKYGGDRYTAPNRDWSYDVDFNDLSNLPPFPPMAVKANDLVAW